MALLGLFGSQAHQIQGQIIHSTGKADNGRDPDPVHNIKVEVYAKGFFKRTLLGSAHTDNDGRFSFGFNTKALTPSELHLRVVDYPWEKQHDWRTGNDARVVKDITLPSTASDEENINTGAVTVDFWEYLPGVPRLRMPKDEAARPQESSPEYKAERIRAGFDDLLAQKVIFPLIKHSATLEDIDKIFSKTLTRAQEEKEPGSTKTGEWMGSRVLNGFNPCPLRKGEGPGQYLVEYNWDKYSFDNVHYLPNTKLKLELVDENLVAKEVSLQYRAHTNSGKALPPVGKGSEVGEWKTYRYGEEGFEDALKEFRIAYMVSGEVDPHVAFGHINVEQYAVAAFRNLRDNPLKTMLFPHLREVVLINFEGTELIFGENGIIPEISGMTGKSTVGRAVEQLGSADWKDFLPRKPISESHDFAHAANIYWDLLKDYVSEFIDGNKEGIAEHWHEVRQMSKDLVEHSVPYHPRDDVTDLSVWVDTRELGDLYSPRPVIDGVTKAIRPFAKGVEPSSEDWDNLKQVCCYAIFMASFWHTWVNDKQREDGGQVTYGPLGRQDDKQGELKDAAEQLFLAHVLAESKHGLILENDNNDIPLALRDRISKAQDAFSKHHYDPHLLRAVINI